MFSRMKTYCLFTKSIIYENLVSYLSCFFFALFLFFGRKIMIDKGNEIILFMFMIVPFISSFIVVPSFYDLFFSEKKELLFPSIRKIIYLSVIKDLIFSLFVILFFVFLKVFLCKYCLMILPMNLLARLLYMILITQLISLVILILTRNKIAVYGIQFLYVIGSVFLLQSNGFLLFTGYMVGNDLDTNFAMFLVKQGWKILIVIPLLILELKRFSKGK